MPGGFLFELSIFHLDESYPKIGGDDFIEDYAKKAIRNLLHTNIYVHSRRLISEFPKYGIKCIEKLQ